MAIHVEVAQAESAAVETALAALRARPPERCARCGGQTFDPQPRNGYWRCSTCSGGTPGPVVTAAEERAAATRARREARAAVLAPGDAALRRRIAVDQQRDRRPLGDLVRGWHDYLLHRARPERYPVTPACREWRDDRLLDLAQKHAEVTGHTDPFALRAIELVPRILFRGGDGWTRAAEGFQTRNDFAALLDGVGATIFLDAYGETIRSFAPWSTAITIADFKSTVVGIVDFPELLAIPEHGEYAAGGPFGPAVRVRLMKFGRVAEFTREAVLRDDIPSFGQLQQALGVAAAQVENDVVYDLLTSNPPMADGQPLFSAAHGNLMAAAALDATSLAEAAATLATISGHGRPAFLLVGTKDGPTARQLMTQQTPPNAGDASGVLQVVQDDRITAGWYVTCDPAERPTVVTAHLRGVEGPELLSMDLWDVDSRAYKGRNEFGAAVVSATSMVFTPAV
jgi:hypothetical protein